MFVFLIGPGGYCRGAGLGLPGWLVACSLGPLGLVASDRDLSRRRCGRDSGAGGRSRSPPVTASRRGSGALDDLALDDVTDDGHVGGGVNSLLVDAGLVRLTIWPLTTSRTMAISVSGSLLVDAGLVRLTVWPLITTSRTMAISVAVAPKMAAIRSRGDKLVASAPLSETISSANRIKPSTSRASRPWWPPGRRRPRACRSLTRTRWTIR